MSDDTQSPSPYYKIINPCNYRFDTCASVLCAAGTVSPAAWVAREKAMLPRPVDIIKTGNVLGEGVQWHTGSGTLWWTDIQARRLHSYHPASGRQTQYPTPERLCSFAFVQGETQLIAAFENGFAFYEYTSQTVRWLSRPEEALAATRFNDGKTDRQGRFWSGTMVETGDPATLAQGSLYSLDGDLETHKHAAGIGIANGLCWTPDSNYMYFADSARRVIYRYDFDREAGTLAARRVFVQTPAGAFPDGAEVDVDGCVWSAHWGAGKVVRYTPAGKIDLEILLPVSQPTCVTFGGDDHDLLFVTTARDGLDNDTLRRQPQAGDIFIYRAGIAGLPPTTFIKTVIN